MKEQKFRKLAVLLAALMSVGLASCGDSDSSSEKESKASDEAVSSAAAEESTPANDESTAGGDVTTAPTDSSEAEELVTAATKSPAEVIAEIPAAEVKSAKLTEVGKFKAEDVSFYGDFLYKEISDDDIEVLDYTGKTFSDKNAVYVDKLGDTGLYAYQIDGSDILYAGLMDAEGNIIFDASEKVGVLDEIDDRFIKAYIPDKVTTDKSEAIYYATNRQFSVDVGSDDIMYTGTVKIYDTLNKKFLESSAQTIDPNYNVHGDIITFYDADSNEVAISAETDEVLDLGNMDPIGKSLLAEYKDGKYYCYDHSKNLLFVTPYNVSEIDGSSDFVSITDPETSKRGIMHSSGAVMVEPRYKAVNQISADLFSYYNDDFTLQGIVKLDGSEIGSGQYKSVMDINIPGYLSVSNQDGKYSLIDLEGKEIIGGQDYGFNEDCYVKDGDTYKHLVISKGEFSLETETSGEYLGNYLLNDYKSGNVYDLVTGEKIFEGVKKAYSAYGYIYVLDGEEYTVYKVEQ